MNDIDKRLYNEFGKQVYRNKYDTKGEQARAAYKSEDLFEASAFQYYGPVQPATERENIEEHIDFHVTGLGSVDVKSAKSNITDGLVWIEIQNVVGEDGWLYGSSKYIAFEFHDHFRLVPTDWLRIRVGDLTSKAREVTWKGHALYNHYTRKKYNRNDILTQVTAEDILFVTEKTLPFCLERDLQELLTKNRSKS